MPDYNRKVLVTGAAGFIGYHFTQKLLKHGYEVVGFDALNDYYDPQLKYARLVELGTHLTNGQIENSNPHFTFIKGNLENKAEIEALFKVHKFDYIVNLAAQAGVRYSLTNPDVYISSNIYGFLNILEAARNYGVTHLVYASSSSVYGLNQAIPFTESQLTDHPISLYAASKKSNELMAHTYAHLFNIPTSGLRFFTVYGPWGRPDMALFMFTKAILAGEPITVFNNGEMLRDFTYIDDIVEGIYATMLNPPAANASYNHSAPVAGSSSAPFAIYNIGNSAPVKLLEFVKAIEAATGKSAIIDMQPLQPGDVPQTYADTTHLAEMTGYTPNTPVNAGINAFIAWYLDYYKIKI